MAIVNSLQRWLLSQRELQFRSTRTYPYEPINFYTDPDFSQFRDNYNSHLRKITAEGKGAVEHYPIVTKEDFQIIRRTAVELWDNIDSLDSNAYSELKYIVTALHVPVRGHDGHACLNISSFTKRVNENGTSVVTFDSTKTNSKTFQGR